MPNTTQILSRSTVVAVVGITSLGFFDAVPVTRAQAPAEHQPGTKHQHDMFRSAKKARRILYSDPRFNVDQVRYSAFKNDIPADVKQATPGDTLVILEGDIELGAEEELEQAAA